jgi:putative PEP-CTERM system histidine kinase
MTLLLVGLYLVILGVIGEGMRYFDVSFGRFSIVFLASTIGAVTVLFEKLRRRLKAFISENFFIQKYDYGNEWLKFTGKLSSCRSLLDVHDAILSAYRQSFGLAGASLYLLDRKKETYTPAANQSMPDCAQELPADTGLIAYFSERGRVFNPLDGEYVATAEEASFIRHAGAGLIVPLMNTEKVEGFVVLGVQSAREDFVYEDYGLMKTLAKQATLSLINCRLSEEIAETSKIVAVGKISSFVIHDLKNLAFNLSLTLKNAEEYIDSPEFQGELLVSLRNTLAAMKVLIERLRSDPKEQTSQKQVADIDLLASETVSEVMKIKQAVEISYHGSPVLSVVDAEEIKKVVLNLVLNALDAVEDMGRIEIHTGFHQDTLYIRVKDNGCGMTKEFLDNRLFKPFNTTKEKGLGIGLYQCKQIVEAHGGLIDVRSEAGKGTVLTVYLPLTQEVVHTLQ